MVASRAAARQTMEFGEWDVDDLVWQAMAEDVEVQVSLPVRRACKLSAAAPESTNEVEVDVMSERGL